MKRGEPRNVALDDCDFYHTMDLPGIGEVRGQWDLRGNEASYCGNASFGGKTVLEIGPASGHLTFWMERQGAHVTVLDLDENDKWDVVPIAGLDLNALHQQRSAHLRRLQNSWWFARGAFRSQASALYGNVYDLSSSVGSFDIVTFGSVLLHLRDPLGALAAAARVCRDTMVVTETDSVERRPLLGKTRRREPALYFQPANYDTWYFVTPAAVEQFLKVVGFQSFVISQHRQLHCSRGWQPFYTVVARRN